MMKMKKKDLAACQRKLTGIKSILRKERPVTKVENVRLKREM